MKIIDARLGDEVQVGVSVIYSNIVEWPSGEDLGPDPGNYTLLEVEENFLSAYGTFRRSDGFEYRIELPVRFLHPRFFLQKVAFVPS